MSLVGGGTFLLADQQPDEFSLIAFYRGNHCPVCRQQIGELDRRMDELAAVGVTSVFAVSGDTQERAQRSVEEWKLSALPVAYDQDVASMREWGLFVSKGIKDGEPDEFGEPGMFLIRPDGTVYWEMISSMPFARPHLDDVINGVKFAVDNDYPARGEA